jgi:hypothetical protein
MAQHFLSYTLSVFGGIFMTCNVRARCGRLLLRHGKIIKEMPGYSVASGTHCISQPNLPSKGHEYSDVFKGRDLVRNSALSRQKMDTAP